ncbi:hypothetical protein PanWU01x14_147940, partial [Parasponia andersonii]
TADPWGLGPPAVMDLRSVRLSRLGSVTDSALNSEDPHADAGITCDPRDPSHGSRLENGPHTYTYTIKRCAS